MEQHVAGCDHGHASTGTLAGDAVQALRLTRAAVDGAGDGGTAWSQGAEVAQLGRKVRTRQQRVEQAFAARVEVGPVQVAAALAGAALTERKQPAEAGPGGEVGRIGQQHRPVPQAEPAAGQQPYAGRLGRLPAAHHASHRVMVGHAQGGQAIGGGLGKQFFRMAGTTEEAVISCDLQFSVHYLSPSL